MPNHWGWSEDRSLYKKGIDQLPNDKPVVYKILTEGRNSNYTGIAGKSHVNDRIQDHLGDIPGAKVQIQQMSSRQDATQTEKFIIARSKPKYSNQGK